jgi:ribonuclease P protein component
VSRGHQAHFSTEQPEAQAAPRVPFAHGHEERSEDPGAPPRQGPQAPQRLSNDDRTYPESAFNDVSLPLERLTARREFLYVAAGASERKRCLVVQGRPRPQPRPSAGDGYTATRKVGNSVVRNRARRRLREAVRIHLPRLGLPGVDYVFIARQDTADCPWPRLLDDMESALVTLRRRIVSGDIRPSPRSANRPSTKG